MGCAGSKDAPIKHPVPGRVGQDIAFGTVFAVVPHPGQAAQKKSPIALYTDNYAAKKNTAAGRAAGIVIAVECVDDASFVGASTVRACKAVS